jgi:diguanylate cyclase (GGDEF)-like protein/PAS domain S-box-containing protein
MEHSPIGMLIADLNGVWGYTKLALQQMLGYTAEEFRALPPGGPSDPEDWKASKQRWQRLLTGEIAYYDITRRFKHKDGHWIWTHGAVSLLRDEEGAPQNLVSQIESLEARKPAEETLAEERERLRITLASISDAVITLNAQTQVTYLNAAAEALLGLDLKAVENRRVHEVIHLVDPESSKTAANLIGQSEALNDAAGHAAGDAMLKKVAETCRSTVRSLDTVARLGGDEFAILLDNCAEERAQLIGNQLAKALNALEIEWLGSHYSIGASMGISMCTMDMVSEKDWLQSADDACYRAKREGRGQLLFAARHI